MRTLVVVTTIVASLVLAASALAVLPAARTKFAGTTSERPINGFRATVTFAAGPGGRTIRNFVFQTLGCFGTGAFPAGTDPYAEEPWRVASIPVDAKGAFSAAVKPVGSGIDAGKMTAKISGSFTGATKVAGKITFSQVQSGSDCGPQTVKFAAAAGTG
jgi:hypothetical protein